VDKNGSVLATSYGGAIDGLNIVLDGGSYGMTLVGNNLTTTITAGVQVMPSEASGLTLLQLPAPTEAPAVVVAATATALPAQPVVVACNATIVGTSVNLRSGPGTGYNVLAYGYQNETYPVGGTNPEQSWVVIGLPNGSAWVSKSLVKLDGGCNNLTVFNIALQNSQPAQITFQTDDNNSFNGNNGAFNDDDHEGHGEHNGGDD